MQFLKFIVQNRSKFVKFVKIQDEDGIEGEDALDCMDDISNLSVLLVNKMKHAGWLEPYHSIPCDDFDELEGEEG